MHFRCGSAVTVAILSDSPTLTTGFARTTARIAGSLARRHVVHCYGLKGAPDDVRDNLGYHVWPVSKGGTGLTGSASSSRRSGPTYFCSTWTPRMRWSA